MLDKTIEKGNPGTIYSVPNVRTAESTCKLTDVVLAIVHVIKISIFPLYRLSIKLEAHRESELEKDTVRDPYCENARPEISLRDTLTLKAFPAVSIQLSFYGQIEEAAALRAPLPVTHSKGFPETMVI